MKLPIDLKDKYLKEILSNISLEDLPGEKWKLVEDFENYAISNYGRIKSLERWVINPYGVKRRVQDRIKKPHVFKYFNKYLNVHFYNVRCTLSHEGKKHGKSVARLVYYHFVEKFDMNSNSSLISYKDDNRFHVHSDNLERLSISNVRSKALNSGRGNKGDYEQAVNQYTVEGVFLASFESIYEASEILGTPYTNILPVINKKRTTAAGFRWFKKEYTLQKKILDHLQRINLIKYSIRLFGKNSVSL